MSAHGPIRIVRRQGGDSGLPDSLNPVLRRVLGHRGLCSAEELDLGLKHLLPVDAMAGVNEATRLLETALEQRWPILVVGDFDADGATSTALCVLVLKDMGAESVDYLVPDRFRFGYGLTPGIVALAAKRRPRLIITVDNGISSLAGVEAARKAGMKVLVTDHHLPGETLPAADVIVNPNQSGCEFPSKNLAGVGVIFYILAALRQRLRSAGWFRDHAEPNLAQYLDLVALGTVADLVRLDRNNRILVEQGLRRLRAGRGRPGIHALLDISGREAGRLSAADLGFAVAPRLNAAGRLEDMSLGIDCLLAPDVEAAYAHAARLDELNHQRRELQADMQARAFEIVDGLGLERERLPVALCLAHDDWHQGIVGLVASRLKERFHRPAVAFAPADTGSDELKGSARSIPGLHIRDALDAVATRHPSLISRFGGHAMAAGLSLPRHNLEYFREAFTGEVQRWLDDDALEGVVHSDGELSPDELCLDTAEALRGAGPWGQGFPEPVFDGLFTVVESRIVGERHLKLRLRHENGEMDAIAFNHGENKLSHGPVHLVYRLEPNEYRGVRRAQLVVTHLQGVTAD